jgi:hypothetical protein
MTSREWESTCWIVSSARHRCQKSGSKKHRGVATCGEKRSFRTSKKHPAVRSHLLHQRFRQSLDAHEHMINPDIHQECNSCVLGRRSAVVDFSRDPVQQPPVKTDVFSYRRMTHECAGDAVAARYVVACVLQNDGGRSDAAEVGDSADLRIHFNAM